jgi:hypothetical protein
MLLLLSFSTIINSPDITVTMLTQLLSHRPVRRQQQHHQQRQQPLLQHSSIQQHIHRYIQISDENTANL